MGSAVRDTPLRASGDRSPLPWRARAHTNFLRLHGPPLGGMRWRRHRGAGVPLFGAGQCMWLKKPQRDRSPDGGGQARLAAARRSPAAPGRGRREPQDPPALSAGRPRSARNLGATDPPRKGPQGRQHRQPQRRLRLVNHRRLPPGNRGPGRREPSPLGRPRRGTCTGEEAFPWPGSLFESGSGTRRQTEPAFGLGGNRMNVLVLERQVIRRQTRWMVTQRGHSPRPPCAPSPGAGGVFPVSGRTHPVCTHRRRPVQRGPGPASPGGNQVKGGGRSQAQAPARSAGRRPPLQWRARKRFGSAGTFEALPVD